LAQGKDLRVCSWIALTNAFVAASTDNLPFNDNHGPYRDLIQLECPSGLRQGFRHEGRVLQPRLCRPMLVWSPHFTNPDAFRLGSLLRWLSTR
jgi:hypothetical protein